MRRISFSTAGESHGRGLVAILQGIPAGLTLEMARHVDPDLKRRHLRTSERERDRCTGSLWCDL